MTEPKNLFDDDDRARPVDPTPAQRPDWLVGADEGASSEQSRKGAAGTPLPFKLSSAADRAADPGLTGGDEPERPKAPIRPVAPQGPPPVPKPVAWTAAASSIPKLKPSPELASESAPSNAEAEEAQPAAPRPKAKAPDPAPPRARAASHREAESEQPERSPLPDFDPPADEEAESPFQAEAPVARPKPNLRPLEEPWWVIALEALRSNRTLQLGIGGAILVLVAILLFWPRGEPGISLHSLRKDPARWDGRIVRIDGRVGDVFPMGGGFAYNLHQGRDTIVVFTRTHHPVSQEHVTVVGSVTTGFLDGEPRQ